MLFTTFTVGDNDYKLRLTAKNCVELERKLGENPLNIFTSVSDGKLPSLEKLLLILRYSLEEYNHGITLDNVYSIYDDFCESGGTIADLMNVIIQVFKSAGFLGNETEEDRKN